MNYPMKKIILVILILTLLGLIIFLIKSDPSRHYTNDPNSAAKPVVKIGVILPLTGNVSLFAESYRNGLILAEKHLSPNTKFHYQLVVEDTGYNMKNVPMIASRLLTLDKVDAGLSIFTPDAMILGPKFSEAKKIYVGSSSWFPEKFLKDKYNFHFYTDIKQEAEMIAAYIQDKEYKNVVMLTPNLEGTLGGSHLIKEALKEKNIPFCQEIIFNAGRRDFKMDLLKLQKNCRPQMYISLALPPEADIILKQIRETAGEKADVTGLDLAQAFLSYKTAEGLTFPMMALPDEKWLSEYDNLFHDDLYFYLSAAAYDIFNVLVDAYENAPAENTIPTGDEISDYIHQKKHFDSSFGDKITVKPNGQVDLPAELLAVRNGKIEKAKN